MSLNSVVLTGRTGKDPESKFTPAGKQVVNLSLAVDYGYGDKKKTSWIDLVAWEKTAETFQKFVHKGSLIGIQGYLQQRSWQTDTGDKRSKVEVVVLALQLLEPKRDGDVP